MIVVPQTSCGREVKMRAVDFNTGWTFWKEGREERTEVTLPHDAMQGEERSAQNASGGACAYYAGGVYVYEKIFTAPQQWRDKSVQLHFGGVYQKSRVYLNGKQIGGCVYGYTDFTVGLEDLHFGEENRLRVVADNSEMPNSRWYTGSGIYRPVTLLVGERIHIAYRGVRVTTRSLNPAQILVETRVESCGEEMEKAVAPGTRQEPYGESAGKEASERDGERGGVRGSEENAGIEIAIEIRDDAGRMVASASGERALIEIPDARLWSDETPALYECRVCLVDQGRIADEAQVRFGIRMLSYSTRGFFVNGKETLLRGGCVHHDNGILGARSEEKAEWRRVRMLKEAGYNAIRSSHNPCAESVLEACDYYGVYVMDEGWDQWYSHKNRCDYASDFMQHYREDLRAMVDKDYNHPSVILYSIGNEVSEPASAKGLTLEKEMISCLHGLDGTRPVTGGMNLMIMAQAAKGKGIYQEGGGRDTSKEKVINSSMMFNMITSVVGTGMNKAANSKKADEATSPALDLLDIAGYNYASGRYPLEGKKHPDRIVFGSETFPQDIARNWAMVRKYPYLIGDFMWTAWDYLGEAGGGAWGYTEDARGFEKPYPWLLADMGAIDILGNPNGELFWAQAVWHRLERPAIAVQPVNHPGKTPAKSSWRGTNAIPSWSWRGCEGNRAVVEVYFDAARIELYGGQKQIGSRKPKGCRAVFRTKYAPGELTAVAFDAAGAETGRARLSSAGHAAVEIAPEQESARPGEVIYIPIRIADEHHIVESNSDRRLAVRTEGGELLAFGSANPRTAESFAAGEYTTYYGQALAVVRAGEIGTLRIIVRDGDEEIVRNIEVRE